MSEQAKQQSGMQPPAVNPELLARIKQLEAERDAANSRADSAEARAIAAESIDGGRAYSGDKPVIPATTRKPLWLFRVRCSAMPAGHPALPELEIKAVDESEAVRQFCLLSKDDKGRQLDPTRYQFTATCLDDQKRSQLIHNRVNNRRLVASGKFNTLPSRDDELKPPQENARKFAAAAV